MAGYESWVDRQIREAQERGEFDNHWVRESHRRRVDGPPVVIGTVDVDALVQRWRRSRPAGKP